MTTKSKNNGVESTPELPLIIMGKKYDWAEQYITGAQVKKIANLPPDSELYLAIKKPWEDETVSNADKVDLAREGIEHFYVKPFLQFTFEGKVYDWFKQYITGTELRQLGKVPRDYEILLSIQKPWEDELVTDDTKVDLARPGIEHFFIRKCGEQTKVAIRINDHPYEVKRGKHTVVELKALDKIPISNDLDEIINGKLTPLPDNGFVIIKGCEQFFSHPKDGSSS